MITIYNNNSDFTAAEIQTILKSNFVKYISSDYDHFAQAAFANVYIIQSILSCNWKLILSNTYSDTQFWICHRVVWLNEVSWSVESDVWCYSEKSNDRSRIFYQDFIYCWWLK